MNGFFPKHSDASIGYGQASRWLLNQPGDALCYVSPARCASSSFTSAKRITRLILRAIGYADRGNSKVACVGVARIDVRRLLQKF